MTATVASSKPVSIFGDGEPVIQSHALLPAARQSDARVPLFGDTDVWDFNGVLRRNANLSAGEWRVTFSKNLAMPGWNWTAREMAMIMANPRHEAVIDAGVHLAPEPCDGGTIIQTISRLRRLAEFGGCVGLPDWLSAWRASDLRRYVRWLHEEKRIRASTMTGHIALIKRLHEIGPALSCGGVLEDPWRGMSARKAAKYAVSDELSTPVVPPEVWFPLVRAAWVYVHTFAPDVLRASRRYDELRASAIDVKDLNRNRVDERLDAWLADPANRIPVHIPIAPARFGQPYEGVNWNLLALFVGFKVSNKLLGSHHQSGRNRRARVLWALESGRPTTNGLIDDLAEVTHPDGTTGPWHPGLDPRAMTRMLFTTRDAAFCLVVALSMMRDSEIHEIRRGSVVEHYNAPAIASTLDKGHRGRPGKHWWITEPVAEAIAVAEAVSIHAEQVFAPLKRPETVAHGDQMLDGFMAAVNAGRPWTGLAEIPASRVRPHMFRKTMAMLTDQFPGSEIALGMQLKHVAKRALANRSTLGYAAADVAWAGLLDQALDAARFRRLKELFGLHKDGKPIGFGPGADRVKDAFDDIIATVQARGGDARGGDARVEEDLLRRAHITIRFGVLNNCLFDENNPAGAVCIENAVIPAGHTGPVHDRCRPDRCRNSMIGIEHVPLHDSHRRTQLKLLEVRGLPAPRRALIHREIDRVDAVLEQVRKSEEQEA
ncbi:hypothetical protein AB0K05_38160 [Nonomuraea sp. NPDC049486]|uniref:hypothetical protein n=1 Tax=Nonomuraea sp. NPDC049486 TaxID=3155773 RepID=UPI0034212331